MKIKDTDIHFLNEVNRNIDRQVYDREWNILNRRKVKTMKKCGNVTAIGNEGVLYNYSFHNLSVKFQIRCRRTDHDFNLMMGGGVFDN
jgi:hypothetical protein